MNNGNEILRLQDQPDNIRLLAAQREMYSAAKCWSIASAIVSLASPLAATLLQIFINLPTEGVIAIDISLLVLVTLITFRFEELVEWGASTQQSFDSNVFGITFENCFTDDRAIRRYAKKYEKSNSVSDLMRWYTVPIAGKAAGEAIRDCQRQNAEWSKNLMYRYLVAEVGAAVVVAAIVGLLIIASGSSPIVWSFLSVPSEWLIVALMRTKRSLSNTKQIASDSSRYDHTGMANIICTQKYIHQYRKAQVLIPDWFYQLWKQRDNELTS